MKIKVVHYISGYYIIQYKRFLFWETLKEVFVSDSLIHNDHFVMGCFDVMCLKGKNLNKEKIDKHNKKQRELYKKYYNEKLNRDKERRNKNTMWEI